MPNDLLPSHQIPKSDSVGHDAECDDDDECEERWSGPDVEWHYWLLCYFVFPESKNCEEEECDNEESDFVGL